MSPGQALAAARREAGLTVAEVSQKTRIREAIIRDIEQDDYSACGGDFYARGHIRAMARAAGADPDPLIRKYDAVHRGPDGRGTVPDRTGQFPAARGPFEPPIAAPNEPTAAFSSLGNFQLVDERGYPAGWSDEDEADAGYAAPGVDHQASDYDAPSPHEIPEIYGAPDPYEAPETYEQPTQPTTAYTGPGGYRPVDEAPDRPTTAYGSPGGYPPVNETPDQPTTAYGSPGGYPPVDEAPETYPEPDQPTTAYGGPGGPGSSGGYRRADELTRDFDAPYKSGAPFDAGAPPEASGEPPSIGGDRSWFLGLTEPPDAGPPVRPGGPARPAHPASEPRRPQRWAAATLVLLAALGLVAYFLLSNSGSTPSANSGSPSGKATTGHSPSPGHRTSPPSSPSHSAPPPPQVLHPASVVAFGPSGAGRGDNPQDARLAIDRAVGTYWQTDWYATPFFGNLKAGTGLLLDMGHPVKITGAQVTLGPAHGARIQLRTGFAPTMGRLHRVASVFDAGGVVHLHTSAPVTARYVLIWFTKLPPNATGNFQVRVYNIKVQ